MQYRVFDSEITTATILIGLPATGKTSFFHGNFTEKHVLVSMDLLKSRSLEQKRIKECIALQNSFVVDNTNPTKDDRARYITVAKSAGYLVCGYFFSSTAGDALARNQLRDKRIPDVAIYSSAKRFQLPVMEEGFDQLFSVLFDGNGGFLVQHIDKP